MAGAGPNPVNAAMPMQQGGTYQPQPFNVNTAAANSLQGAMAGTQQAMNAPLQVGAYMNPYTDAVINRTQDDIERQRQMASNNLSAQANAANAFGGSRQGVAEGVLAGEYGRMSGDMAARQRQSGYGQALNAAMADRNARAGYAGQLGGLGQQAFSTGQAINQQQMMQGTMQQALQQSLYDAARNQFAGYSNAPMNSLSAPLAALGAAPAPQSSQTQTNPGILGTLGVLKYAFPQMAMFG